MQNVEFLDSIQAKVRQRLLEANEVLSTPYDQRDQNLKRYKKDSSSTIKVAQLDNGSLELIGNCGH